MRPEAGRSASEQARRTREKIQRLERSAAAWEAGASGEQATAVVLSRLPPTTWTVWHDVRWPGRPRANIDHVVVGPPGVFVIDSKNWSGRLTVASGVLKQNGHSRESTVAGVAEAGLAVYQLVPDVPVYPVMCFVRDESLTGWVRDVILCSTDTLEVMMQTRPPALTPEQVGELATRLDLGLSAAGSSSGRATRRATSKERSATGHPSRRQRSSVRRPLVSAGLGLFIVFTTMGFAAPAVDWIRHQVVGGVAPHLPNPEDTDKRGSKKPEQPRKDQN